MRVARADDVAQLAPGLGVGQRRQLPPVRHHADLVEALDRGDDQVRAVIGLHPRRDDLEQEFVAGGVASALQLQYALFLCRLEISRIIWLVEDQRLHHMLGRPVAQRLDDVRPVLVLERHAAWQLDGTGDPYALAGQSVESVAAELVVDDNAGTGDILTDALGRLGD
jgi:hypothetical protein